MFPLPGPREGRKLKRDPGNEADYHIATSKPFKPFTISRVLHGHAIARLRNFSWRLLKRREIKGPCTVLFICKKNNEIINHFTFTAKDVIYYYVTTATVIFTRGDNMLFSRVNTSCFRAKAPLVFRWLLSNKATYFLPNLLFQGLWRR